MRPILALLVCLTPICGQSLSGTWCAVNDARDCVTIRQTGDSVQASFALSGSPQSEGAGWARNGRIAVAFRRLDNSDVGTWNAELDSSGRLAGRTINPNGTVRWTGVYARPGAGAQPSTPPAVSGNIDPSGTWRHTPDATWTITAAGGGRYQAQENGLSYASGPAYFTTAGTFRIDYKARDGSITGYYEMRFANDGRTAAGNVRELTGPKRSGTSNWTRVSGASATQPSTPAVSGNIDPSGTWRHSPDGTWTITAAGGGRYQAQENGLGYSSGPAYFTAAGAFRIDYKTRDGSITGYYEMRFANDGRTAAGNVRELTGPKRSGTSNWTRVSGGNAVQPSTPPVVSGNIDPSGTWRHTPDATWTITAAGGGRYQAQENGLGYSSGPAYFTAAGAFRIDYKTRDGSVSGYYEMRFANDGRTAAGNVRELTGPKRSGTSNWTRVSGGGVSSSGKSRGEPWLPGSFDWVSGQFLVVHPQNRFTVYLKGSKINEGRWEYMGDRRFRSIHEKGGYIDTVEVSADDKYLTGRNNQGTELRGTRRVTSPRP